MIDQLRSQNPNLLAMANVVKQQARAREAQALLQLQASNARVVNQAKAHVQAANGRAKAVSPEVEELRRRLALAEGRRDDLVAATTEEVRSINEAKLQYARRLEQALEMLARKMN